MIEKLDFFLDVDWEYTETIKNKIISLCHESKTVYKQFFSDIIKKTNAA